MIKSISILGSTGSIGTQTLEVAKYFSIQVDAISANRSVEKILEQIKEFKPKLVSMGDESSAIELKEKLKKLKINVDVMWGDEGNLAVATFASAQMVVAAMVGIAGLKPVIAAINAKKDVALANKETLVGAGQIVMELARRNNVAIYPVDSEHSAIWQCLNDFDNKDINRIFLTASGGPFKGKNLKELSSVNAKQALKHPTWDMGGKITIDSATLMNKGLEVIEACFLFDVKLSQIEVVVHPQSIIHSMVEFKDGSVMAQMGFPDMKLPIQIALMKKIRTRGDYKPFNPFLANNLTFDKPDIKTFRCLQLAFDAMNFGGTMPAVMNSANECAVESFLKDEVSFLQIPEIIEEIMNIHQRDNFIRNYTLDDIYYLDNWTTKIFNKIKRRK